MADKETEGKKITVRLPGMPKINPWIITTVILLVLCLLLIVQPGLFGLGITGQVTATGGLTADEAGTKAIEYLRSMGYDCSLVSVEEFDNPSLYVVTTSLGGTDIPIHVTKDGRFIFSLIADTDLTVDTTTTTQPQEVPKSDKPEAHAFVMSYCPYGLQFLKAYVPVIELLGDKANLELNFVDYAMHGETEIYENLRMYCIQKEQKSKLTDYLRCFVVEGDYEGCIESVGIDKAQLETCTSETDEEFKITELLNDESSWESSFPPFNTDKELCEQYGVSGSPTFVINGQTVSVNRSPEAIKQAVCNAFNNPPDECDQELSTTAEQPGLGPIGTGSGASSGGVC